MLCFCRPKTNCSKVGREQSLWLMQHSARKLKELEDHVRSEKKGSSTIGGWFAASYVLFVSKGRRRRKTPLRRWRLCRWLRRSLYPPFFDVRDLAMQTATLFCLSSSPPLSTLFSLKSSGLADIPFFAVRNSFRRSRRIKCSLLRFLQFPGFRSHFFFQLFFKWCSSVFSKIIEQFRHNDA